MSLTKIEGDGYQTRVRGSDPKATKTLCKEEKAPDLGRIHSKVQQSGTSEEVLCVMTKVLSEKRQYASVSKGFIFLDKTTF